MTVRSPKSLDALLARAREGDSAAVNELFQRYYQPLRRMVELRLDDRLRGRVDPSDIVQEAQLEVFTRLSDYLANPALPFHLWLRLEVGKHLMLVYRRHIGTQMRDVRREVPLTGPPTPGASSLALAEALIDSRPSPGDDAMRAEQCTRIRQALEGLDPIDREVLTLRHFELLSREETAQLLGISAAAAAKRYVRALERMRTALAELPGGLDGL
jgi:RNA polymerase sigma-70 factor (ECF subfamily)